ncbi:uncharacterized protein BDZ99DRAFT_225848 [Mytilinidion resinicola]|uniref:Uncharacterized protein n=1 Tax=Mytilinidion resinicola TaxID=574789 RepID=A0A6A6Z0T0_9PEZI|nr:uncharacterized protein BDZ99DRAFT_225848 [Mytilinidion resinicola]KAF2813827.1 hypothetical protein BDZ99DRAFT_225848 [Mytilinidion resinicola]
MAIRNRGRPPAAGALAVLISLRCPLIKTYAFDLLPHPSLHLDLNHVICRPKEPTTRKGRCSQTGYNPSYQNCAQGFGCQEALEAMGRIS